MAADPIQMVPQFIPLPSTANLVNPVDGPYLTFPPFPTAPEGVTIMPFKNFKEGGICVEPGVDDIEIDTLGIPTVPIKVRHSTDECKTKSKRKRKAENAKGNKKGKISAQRIWWEQWEDAEAMRFSTGFNPHASEYERIIAAATDFTSGRVWPVNFASETGPKFIWEKFQRYLGVQEGAAVPSAKQTKKLEVTEPKEDEDDFDDDEMDVDDDEDGGPGIIPDPVTGLIDVNKIQVPAPGKPNQLTAGQKLKVFFDDPEKSIKVFMSSYSRSMGYIWANANLDCIPRVLGFFVNYLLRSKVLPEMERGLRRSLEVIKVAMTELPNTSNIAKTFPDKFSSACNTCWGQKADGYMTLSASEEGPVEGTLDEPEAKKQKCDTDIVDIPVPVEPEQKTPVETTSTWGTSGDCDWAAEGSSWGQNVEVIEENMAWSSLTVEKPETFFPLLGPTVLPLTHSPGIVERSMRKIMSIARPPPSVPKSPPLPDGVYEPKADAVELALDHRFAKVVMAPMIDWDGGESPVYTRPSILVTSRGTVVQDGDAPPTAQPNGFQPYNPASDEITLLIDNDATHIDYLREGMAIGGTWVQLVRQGEPTVAAKKKKGKSKKSSYWYMDELAIVVPSFWTLDD